MDLTVAKDTQLLDFLLSEMKGTSRTKIKSLLKYGQISVNGKAVTAFDHPLRPGNVVSVKKGTKEIAAKREPLDIIYEDESLIVINKPAGLLSVPNGPMEEKSAYGLVLEYVRSVNSRGKAHIVHRLDEDTSGVLLFAKNIGTKQLLHADWNNIVTVRGYYAVVEGTLPKKQDVITTWLREDGPQVTSFLKQVENSRQAVTEYQVLRENEEFSLLQVFIKTGRKNQIRVHMQKMGHPVVGDRKYGSKINPMRRLGLHAYKLELNHPEFGKLCFESKMPRAFGTLVKNAPPSGE